MRRFPRRYVVLTSLLSVMLCGLSIMVSNKAKSPQKAADDRSASGEDDLLSGLELPQGIKSQSKDYKVISIVVSASIHGEVEPCGCTKPALGGISRRATVISKLKERPSKPSLILDAGDFLLPPPLLRMGHLREIDDQRGHVLASYAKQEFSAFCPGEQDLQDGLGLIGELGSAKVPPLILTNVRSEDPSRFQPLSTIDSSGIRLLILNIMDQDIFNRWGLDKKGLRWEEPILAIRRALESEKEPVDWIILTAHTDKLEVLRTIVKTFPRIRTVVSGHLSPSRDHLQLIESAVAVAPPERGTQLAVLQLLIQKPELPFYELKRLEVYDVWLRDYYRRRKEYDEKGLNKNHSEYQSLVQKIAQYEGFRAREAEQASRFNLARLVLIPLSEGIEQDRPTETQVQRLKKWIAEEHLKRPAKSTWTFPYVGSEKCGSCHKKQQEIWSQTKHARAYLDLKPEDRHNDECLSCHVTGFRSIREAFDEPRTILMAGIQCEMCHGPGANHPPERLPKSIDPFLCISCHNSQRDPRFVFGTYVGRGCCFRE